MSLFPDGKSIEDRIKAAQDEIEASLGPSPPPEDEAATMEYSYRCINWLKGRMRTPFGQQVVKALELEMAKREAILLARAAGSGN